MSRLLQIVNRKGAALYAIVMGAPKTTVTITSLGTTANLLEAPIDSISLLGCDEKLTWSQAAGALAIEAPRRVPSEIAVVFKISRRR